MKKNKIKRDRLFCGKTEIKREDLQRGRICLRRKETRFFEPFFFRVC